MKQLDYGDSISGEFFQFIHEVCTTEMNVSMEPHRTVQWTASPDIFAGYLALNPVTLKLSQSRQLFRVSKFCLELDGGDTSLGLSDPSAELDDDPFSRAILDDARKIFDSHDHDGCRQVAFEREQARRQNETRLVGLRTLSGGVLKP